MRIVLKYPNYPLSPQLSVLKLELPESRSVRSHFLRPGPTGRLQCEHPAQEKWA